MATVNLTVSLVSYRVKLQCLDQVSNGMTATQQSLGRNAFIIFLSQAHITAKGTNTNLSIAYLMRLVKCNGGNVVFSVYMGIMGRWWLWVDRIEFPAHFSPPPAKGEK